MAVSLAVSAALFFVYTAHWPLVGDASLMHYMVFLIQRGWAPYRQFQDMNMPGSFLVERAAMQVFGDGAAGWRLFDFSLLAGASCGLFALLGRRRWFAVLFASSLFVLIHGRDGLAQGGQRDLTIAVSLLCGTAMLAQGAKSVNPLAFLGWGMLSGLALTIKPTALLLAPMQFLALVLARRPEPWQASRVQRSVVVAAAAAGWFAMPAACLIFLLRRDSFSAFITTLRTVVPFYAGLGHRSSWYVFQHSLSPLVPLVAAWVLVLILLRVSHGGIKTSVERTLLLSGAAFGLLNCMVQARALPYYRYPLLIFLLPLIAFDLDQIVFRRPNPEMHAGPRFRKTISAISVAALAFGSLLLAPQSALLIHRYRWRHLDMQDSLQNDLRALGGSSLSGHIHCLDTNSGCITVLYRMRLEPASGILSDMFLFDGAPKFPGVTPVVQQTRAAFWSALRTQPPDVLVVTSPLYLGNLDDFKKLQRWPALEDLLSARYELRTEWRPSRKERWWSREEFPASYRIYVLRGRGGRPDTETSRP